MRGIRYAGIPGFRFAENRIQEELWTENGREGADGKGSSPGANDLALAYTEC